MDCCGAPIGGARTFHSNGGCAVLRRARIRSRHEHEESRSMSTTTEQSARAQPADEQAAAATAPAAAKPARTGRRWPWIAALVVVAALGATGTAIAASSAADAQAELASLQEDYADLETRSGIAQSSLDLIRDHRDRLELQLEEMQASQG